MLKDSLLAASWLFSIVSILPYARDILKGKTKPNITTWLTWTILSAIATAAAIAAGENRSAIFSGAITVQVGVIVLLGLKYGYAKYSIFDWTCQISALVGLLLWWLFDSPTIALVAAVTIDLVGALPTVRHSFLKPYEETASSYLLASLGGVLALLALTSYNFESMLYASYIALIDGSIAAVIITRQKTVKEP